MTRGRGITIHRTDCINVITLPEAERSRLIEAEWDSSTEDSHAYPVGISVYGDNRTGLLVDISRIFLERKIDLKAMNVRTSHQGTATIDMTFEVSSQQELRDLMEKVRQVQSVIDVQRARGEGREERNARDSYSEHGDRYGRHQCVFCPEYGDKRNADH